MDMLAVVARMLGMLAAAESERALTAIDLILAPSGVWQDAVASVHEGALLERRLTDASRGPPRNALPSAPWG